jgi:molecular chaperone GrpE
MSDSENVHAAQIEDGRQDEPTPEQQGERAPRRGSGDADGERGVAQVATDPDPARERPSPEEEAVRVDLEAARRRVDDLARALQALERDKEDFKKRLLRERERMIEIEKGNVVQTLLEAIDELDMSLLAADDSPLAQGVRLIRDNMVARLASLGVERVSLVGQTFDPNLAEAVDTEITANPHDDQKVVHEVRPAYRLKDRVVRPGRVKVFRYVQPAQA